MISIVIVLVVVVVIVALVCYFASFLCLFIIIVVVLVIVGCWHVQAKTKNAAPGKIQKTQATTRNIYMYSHIINQKIKQK